MRRGIFRLSRRGRRRAGIFQRYRDERRRKRVRDAAEAEALSKEANAQLADHGLKPNPTPVEAGAAHPDKIPVVCPNCGAALPSAKGADEVQCEYCGSTIRAGG